MGIAGPLSRDVLSKLTDADMSQEKFKFLTVKDIEIAGIPVKALRLSYTGIVKLQLNVHSRDSFNKFLANTATQANMKYNFFPRSDNIMFDILLFIPFKVQI